MIRFIELHRAHRGYVLSLRANLHNCIDPHQVCMDVKPIIHNLLNLNVILRLRILICLNIIFAKYVGDEEEIMQAFYFCSHAEQILSSHQTNAAIDSCFMKILNSIENFIRNGSSWQIKHVTYIDLHIGKYREIRGGCKNIV